MFNGTIKENIQYNTQNMTEDNIREAAEKANALGFIEKNQFEEIMPAQKAVQTNGSQDASKNNNELGSGFNRKVGPKGTQISGGQKQRIAIARAIAKDPQILLLDEATSALDTENEKIVQDSLDKLMKGKTTLAIAHRISTIKDSNVIYVIEDGNLVESGSYEELVKKKGYFYRLERGELK